MTNDPAEQRSHLDSDEAWAGVFDSDPVNDDGPVDNGPDPTDPAPTYVVEEMGPPEDDDASFSVHAGREELLALSNAIDEFSVRSQMIRQGGIGGSLIANASAARTIRDLAEAVIQSDEAETKRMIRASGVRVRQPLSVP